MPELPEVETYARDLARVLPGRSLHGARCDWPNQLPLNAPDELDARVRGQHVSAVTRRGKYIQIELDQDWLLVHLKMSGRLQITPAGTPANPHAHVVFDLDGADELRFHDPRKFGRVYLVEEPDEVVGHLGPEPLEPDFTRALFAERIAPRRGRLKPLLLDQAFLAGLGNIYVDEALWQARLHPLRTADTLGEEEVARLHTAIVEVLARAVALRGTSFSAAGYRDLTGNMGEMQGTLNVFRRTGEPCPRCGAPIERSLVAMRGTHTCPRCQGRG
jgi:formamidopyrimidine-DNA glycosylase